MRNIIFLSICLIGYIAFILWCVYKLKDISRNPKKYDKVKGRDKYAKSFWYEPWYKRYGKNYHASLITGIPCIPLFMYLYSLVGKAIQRFLLTPADSLFLQSVGTTIGACGALFFAIAVWQFLLFSVNCPIFVAARLYVAHPPDNYVKAWRNVYLWLLVLGILCLPIMAVGINANSYADEEKIVTHGHFSLAKREIPYEAIEAGTTWYSSNENHTEFTFHYTITLEDGTEFAISDFDSEGTRYIDSMLREKGVPVDCEEIDTVTCELMKKVCSEEKLKEVEYYFVLVE